MYKFKLYRLDELKEIANAPSTLVERDVMQIHRNQTDCNGYTFTLVKFSLASVYTQLHFVSHAVRKPWYTKLYRGHYVLGVLNDQRASVYVASESDIDYTIKSFNTIDYRDFSTFTWDFINSKGRSGTVINQLRILAGEIGGYAFNKPAARRKCDCPIDVLMGQGCQCGGD